MPSEDHSLLCFDADDYRMLRIEELRLAAMTAAEKAIRTRAPFRFNPMTSRERRVIHMALRGQSAVRSESIGVGTAPPGGDRARRHAHAHRGIAGGVRVSPSAAVRRRFWWHGLQAVEDAPRRHHRRNRHTAGTRRPGNRASLGPRGPRGSPKSWCASARPRLAKLDARNWPNCPTPAGTPWTRWWSPSSRRRAPTPPKTWSRSPATAPRSFCAIAWSAPAGGRAPGRARRIHAARVPERPPRSAAGRGRARPDRSAPRCTRRAWRRSRPAAPSRAASRRSRSNCSS